MNGIKKIWISGASGRLGTELIDYLDPIDVEIIATDKDTVDITNSEEVTSFVDRNRPSAIINCSALTDVLYCEENPDEAFLINGYGAKNMAIAARRINAKLVHLSSDDVFSGDESVPYKEFDKVNPKSNYGKSKVFGERYVRTFCQTHFIIRTSWRYGERNRRVENIIELAKAGKEIVVAKDQFAAPTSAREIAKFIEFLLGTHEYGTYHAVCTGSCSRKEFAEEVLSIAGLEGKVVEDESHKNILLRPNYSVLDDFLLRITGIYKFPDWKLSLFQYISRINGGTHGK